MDIIKIRLRNLQYLKVQFDEKESVEGIKERGSQKRFATHVGISAAYLSHIFNGVKAIGHRHARGIESKLKLQEGWMDVDHLSGAILTDSRGREFGALAMRLYGRWPEEVRTLLMRYMEEKMFSEDSVKLCAKTEPRRR